MSWKESNKWRQHDEIKKKNVSSSSLVSLVSKWHDLIYCNRAGILRQIPLDHLWCKSTSHRLFHYHYKAMIQIKANTRSTEEVSCISWEIRRSSRISANKYQSIHSLQSKKMQQSSHSHLHMAGQHNHRKHAPYYLLQEHHVIPTQPFLAISTHHFIRSNLIIPPPSSCCKLFTSSTPPAIASCLCDSPNQPTRGWFLKTLHQLFFQ